MSTYTGVTNFAKTVHFWAHPVYVNDAEPMLCLSEKMLHYSRRMRLRAADDGVVSAVA